MNMYYRSIVAVLAFGFAGFASAQDQCKNILEPGFYNKTQTANSGNYVQDVKNWLKSDKLREHLLSSGTNFGLNVPVEGIPLGLNFGSKDQDYQNLRDFLNEGNTNYINQSFANYVASQIVDVNVVNAWNKCMAEKAEQIGLVGIVDGEANETFFLRLRWYPSLGVASAKIGSIWVSGANYNREALKTGDTVGSNWIPIAFTRNGNAQVSIAINTENSIGSFAVLLPPAGAQKTNRQLCLEGDEAGCVKYKDEIRTKCPPDPTASATPQATSEYLNCKRVAQCYGDRAITIAQMKDVCESAADSPQCLQVKARLVNVDPAVCDGIPNQKNVF